MHTNDDGVRQRLFRMTEGELVEELNLLRAKYDAACHHMHKGEMIIRRLEGILESYVDPQRLKVDKETSTAHDFGLQTGPVLTPYTQLLHLDAALSRAEADYESIRQFHVAEVSRLSREGLQLMAVIGDQTAALAADLDPSMRARLAAAAGQQSVPSYDSGNALGAASVALLPSQALVM